LTQPQELIFCAADDDDRSTYHMSIDPNVFLASIRPKDRITEQILWPIPKLVDLLIESFGHYADPGLIDPFDPQLLREPFDLSGRYPIDVGFLNDLHKSGLTVFLSVYEER
jgi:hypothetical protein